eukprot:CAMPEP_0198500104 /NCGR_PEP_ID=MMETSP1462-20131121/7995_1 /TAXON_ID=1333877 /ORGANISM="Brandtodinium nutriculum, Strain RCC3387" /LENGTH=332 /DNA_ID=CAMNT_0044229111 /DNA_START=238 /DNA_END=1233 /DNA_ORIENTATION=+
MTGAQVHTIRDIASIAREAIVDKAVGDGYDGLNVDLGCSGKDNAIAALLLGVLGGAFACILPCGGLCYQSQRTWLQDFVSAPADEVGRASAEVTSKWIAQGIYNNSDGSYGHSVSYMFLVKFFARGKPGEASYNVSARTRVTGETYDNVAQGSDIEVAYRLGNVREFILVEDAGKWSRGSGILRCVCCALSAFMGVGLVVGAASLPLTGCYLGFIPLALFLVGGALAGKFLCFPLVRKISQSSFYVTVTPCSPVERPIATVVGEASAEDEQMVSLQVFWRRARPCLVVCMDASCSSSRAESTSTQSGMYRLVAANVYARLVTAAADLAACGS